MSEEKDFDLEQTLESRLVEGFDDEVNFFGNKSQDKLKSASKSLPEWSLEPPFGV